MIQLFRKRALSFNPAFATRFPVTVHVPAFPYIAIPNSNGSGLSQNNKTRKINRKSFVRSECTIRSTKGDDKLDYKLYMGQFTGKSWQL